MPKGARLTVHQIITHADYTLAGPAAAGMVPAKPGETVIAWGTGDCSTPVVTVAAKTRQFRSRGVWAPVCARRTSWSRRRLPLLARSGQDFLLRQTRYTLWIAHELLRYTHGADPSFDMAAGAGAGFAYPPDHRRTNGPERMAGRNSLLQRAVAEKLSCEMSWPRTH